MNLTRRSLLVYGLLAAVWALVIIWQVEEHLHVREVAKTELRNSSRSIANTLSAIVRSLRFRGRGMVLENDLQRALNELVSRTNELVKSSEIVSIVLLNAANEPVVTAGNPVETKDMLQTGEQRWSRESVMLVNPVDLGAIITSEGVTNPAVVLASPFTNNPDGTRQRPRREPRPEENASSNTVAGLATNLALGSNAAIVAAGGDTNRFARDGRPRGRPPWLRNLPEEEYESLMEKHALHGLALVMSTDSFRNAWTRDLWLRSIIVLLATFSVIGSGLAWGNLVKSSDLQLRLVRASEMNTHLKEMAVAAAGLAHETRNPLNIIRGLAQMISKRPDAAPEIQQKTREILNETDKVTAQLNEFINYSRPREVRRSVLPVNSVVGEVVRALNYDLEEKKIALEVKADPISIEADEQLLRQALFNLLLNAVQAADGDGRIEVVAEKRSASEALLEVRDNGPGVPAEQRQEIFKPYFTTQKTGTGLGLAVVQQIVLAHGWEIECLPNTPKGAIFRITHLKLAG
jgi:signal transduction histidine kinase